MTSEDCRPVRRLAGRRSWTRGLLAVAMLAGCGPAPPPVLDTGAKEVARGYTEGLQGQRWSQAYAALDPASRARCGAEQFAYLAANYRRSLAFEPENAHVRSCEEQGAKAIAHVIFRGHGACGHRFHKESIILRRTEAGWGVVLPRDFGRTRSR